MYNRKFLLLFLFILFQLKAFPAVFVVTSNADSGPGTLREALLDAEANNGTTVDHINFNLPDLSENGRTIILYTALPGASSNLVIDGTTQPGNKFGVSDAHVQLQYQTPVLRGLAGLAVHNRHDVAIYGLYINLVTNINPPSNAYSFLYNGIELVDDKNIQIGAAGKGNVINGFPSPLAVNPSDTIHHESTTFPFENITLQDNFFGIAADGETLSVNKTYSVGLSFVLKQVTIGGTPAEGNLFAEGLSISEQNSEDPSDTDPRDAYATESANILIQNNKIGVDYNIEHPIPNSDGIDLGSIDPNGHETVNIFDNIITASNSYAIYPINIGGKITILRNYIGTDKTLQKKFVTGGIFVYWDTQVAIGSTDPADANYITNCNPVTVWPYTNATVNKNSFFCTVYQQPMHFYDYGETSIPQVTILNITSNAINGTATPNSIVELFYSDICGTCSPQTYFASIIVDNNGKWKYNGPVTGPVIASATLGQNTSDFTKIAINTRDVKIINPCNDNKGAIIGIVPSNAVDIKWYDSNGKLVGTAADLTGVKPGKYKLVVKNGDCADSTSFYEIKNVFQVDSSKIKITQPSCGDSNGSVAGIKITNNNQGQTNLSWKDISGTEVGNNTNLTNVAAGTYTLYISDANNNCSTTYGPVTLTNTTGPNIDQTQQQIQPTNCGQSTGAITNIKISGGTGNYQYTWLDAQKKTVGTDINLTGQPAGVYTLEITDGGSCGPIYSTDISILETNGITLDESKANTSPATCGLSNGSVAGITVTGATQYTWIDANGKTYSTTTPDLINAPAGGYILTASNSTGCSKISKLYTILQPAPTQYPTFSYTSHGTCQNASTGSIIITITTDNLIKSLRWVNSAGQNVGYDSEVDNLPAGAYQLYFTDYSGCETLYNSYTINAIPQLMITAGSEQKHNDQCETGTGYITGIKVQGGLTPYTYSWKNDAGTIVSQTADLENAKAGNYILTVNDASGCGPQTANYTIQNNDESISPPVVNDIQLCSPGAALLRVNDPLANYSYRLYNSAINPTLVDEQKSGVFKITADANSSYYVSQFLGDCESARTQVHISIGITGVNIANAFTPNGDGINDHWEIKNIENYPNALIQVFNRYGKKLFESKGYPIPFDGSYNGQKLPAGVYYYIINLGIKCNLLSGSLTIIR